MMEREEVTLEELNAFLDGALDREARDRVLSRLDRDPALRKHLHELQRARQALRDSFPTPAQCVTAGRHTSRALIARAVAAGLLVTAGFLFGWMLQPPHSPDHTASVALKLPDGSLMLQPLPAESVGNPVSRVLLHISESDPRKFESALDRVEDMLRQHENEADRFRIEVVANAGGIDLLLAGSSAYAERIGRLQEHHPNLTFLACKQALENLRQARGKDVPLLRDVKSSAPALEHIIRRLEEGWVYTRI